MQEIYNLIKERHSVRDYKNKKIEGKIKESLENVIEKCNKEGKLNIKLFLDEPKAFDNFMARYGNFKNVKNYIVMIGNKSNDLEERCGYYGERIVLEAQRLGLNTCWVGMTYAKSKVPYKLKQGEKIVIAIAIGYGKTNGVSHKIKKFSDVSITKHDYPDWYKKGVDYALLAPTAVNQQKFLFELINDHVVKISTKMGFFSKVDLGIAKYHFELGALNNNFNWDK